MPRLLLVAPEHATHEDAIELAEKVKKLIRDPSITVKPRWHGEKGILIEGKMLAELYSVSIDFGRNGIPWDCKEEEG